MPFSLTQVEPSIGFTKNPKKLSHSVESNLATFDPIEERIEPIKPTLESFLIVQKILELEIQTRYDLY